MKLFERIFRRKELRRLRIVRKQFEMLLKNLTNQNYMILSRMEKYVLLAALKHWSFRRHVIEEPKTKYIHRKIYKALVERLEKELKG